MEKIKNLKYEVNKLDQFSANHISGNPDHSEQALVTESENNAQQDNVQISNERDFYAKKGVSLTITLSVFTIILAIVIILFFPGGSIAGVLIFTGILSIIVNLKRSNTPVLNIDPVNGILTIHQKKYMVNEIQSYGNEGKYLTFFYLPANAAPGQQHEVIKVPLAGFEDDEKMDMLNTLERVFGKS